MEMSEVGQGSLEVLYQLWRGTDGKYIGDKKKEEFVHRYFGNPSITSSGHLVKQDGKVLGAVLLETYDWGIYLYDWIEYRKYPVFEEIMDKINALLEERNTIILAPLFGRDADTEGWKKAGFELFKKAPYNLLMKKELNENDESKEIEANIENLKDFKEKLEHLATLFTEIGWRWDDTVKMSEYLRWELKGDMDYLLAIKEGKPIGYCGIETRGLFSGDIMHWIKELGVHPDERGKGIATDLLLHTIRKVRNDGGMEIYIDTHSENPAKKLYEKLGFQVVERTPNLRYELGD